MGSLEDMAKFDESRRLETFTAIEELLGNHPYGCLEGYFVNAIVALNRMMAVPQAYLVRDFERVKSNMTKARDNLLGKLLHGFLLKDKSNLEESKKVLYLTRNLYERVRNALNKDPEITASIGFIPKLKK